MVIVAKRKAVETNPFFKFFFLLLPFPSFDMAPPTVEFSFLNAFLHDEDIVATAVKVANLGLGAKDKC